MPEVVVVVAAETVAVVGGDGVEVGFGEVVERKEVVLMVVVEWASMVRLLFRKWIANCVKAEKIRTKSDNDHHHHRTC